MNSVAIVLQVVLGLMFLMAGFTKLGAKQQVQAFEHYGYPQWFRVVTGVVELVAAVGLLAGIWYPHLAPLAGLLLAVTMLGAVITHMRVQDPAKATIMPLAFLVLSVLVTIIKWHSLVA